MGNLGKFKKKAKNINKPNNVSTKKGQKLLAHLGINYGMLLEHKEWEKVNAMLQWAKEHQDPITLEAINTFNLMVAEQLNLPYKSLPLEKRLSFLLDNPQYAEEFFSRQKLNSPTEFIPQDSQEHQMLTKLYSQENKEAVTQYLDIVSQSKKKP